VEAESEDAQDVPIWTGSGTKLDEARMEKPDLLVGIKKEKIEARKEAEAIPIQKAILPRNGEDRNLFLALAADFQRKIYNHFFITKPSTLKLSGHGDIFYHAYVEHAWAQRKMARKLGIFTAEIGFVSSSLPRNKARPQLLVVKGHFLNSPANAELVKSDQFHTNGRKMVGLNDARLKWMGRQAAGSTADNDERYRISLTVNGANGT